jgi:hypothetical protein
MSATIRRPASHRRSTKSEIRLSRVSERPAACVVWQFFERRGPVGRGRANAGAPDNEAALARLLPFCVLPQGAKADAVTLSTDRKAFGLTPMMRARSFVLSVASASRISVSSPVVHRLRGRLSDSTAAVGDRREMVTVAHEQETTDGAFGFRVCCSEVLHTNHT